MIHAPEPCWLPALLALSLFADALMSVRPPMFIQRCLDGVRFPREWWWTLITIKLAATAGLLAGLKYPGIGFATAVGVIAYFLCAAYAHYRARFLGYEFWINCLGMLTLSIAAALPFVI
jgi:hypothetical protein